MVGYYKKPEETEKVLKDGWLNTGDIVMLTYNDEIKIIGRAKDTIVLLGGENVEPEPIEDKLCQSDYIEQAMVVGQDLEVPRSAHRSKPRDSGGVCTEQGHIVHRKGRAHQQPGDTRADKRRDTGTGKHEDGVQTLRADFQVQDPRKEIRGWRGDDPFSEDQAKRRIRDVCKTDKTAFRVTDRHKVLTGLMPEVLRVIQA